MECPRCRFEQPPAAECARCGVVFAKLPQQRPDQDSYSDGDDVPSDASAPGGGVQSWYSGDPSEVAAADSPPSDGSLYGLDDAGGMFASPTTSSSAAGLFGGDGSPPPAIFDDVPPATHGWGAPPAPGEDSAAPAPRPKPRRPPKRSAEPPPEAIGGGQRGLRVVLAIAACGIAASMAIGGRAIDAGWPVALLAGIGLWGLWSLASVKATVTPKQFGVEVIVLVGLLGAVAAVDPAMFSPVAPPPAPEPEVAGPPDAAQEPHLPDTPLGRFTERTLEYLSGVESLLALEGAAGYGVWQDLESRLAWDGVESAYATMSKDDKARAFAVWTALKPLGGEIRQALERHKKPSANGFVLELGEDARRAIEQHHEASLEAARGLETALRVR